MTKSIVEARLKNTGELIGMTEYHCYPESISVTFDRPIHSDEGPIVLTVHLGEDVAAARYWK